MGRLIIRIDALMPSKTGGLLADPGWLHRHSCNGCSTSWSVKELYLWTTACTGHADTLACSGGSPTRGLLHHLMKGAWVLSIRNGCPNGCQDFGLLLSFIL
jgi:hypothetical protein